MQTARTRLLCLLVGFTIAIPLMSAPPLKAQDDCKTIYKMLADAQVKLYSTPAHLYTTSKIGGQTFSSEIIYAAGSMYMKINGKWTVASSIKDLQESEKDLEHKANPKETCHHVKDEPVGGNMATVYSSHSETAKGTLDMQIWISKAQGLVLRTDLNSDGGKDIVSTRYEYGDIKPPI
jgi:outer membrane lipoprotein-sorting protein